MYYYFKSLNIDPDEMVCVSPDMGGANRTRHFAKKLDCPIAIIDKRRDKHNEAIASHIIGDYVSIETWDETDKDINKIYSAIFNSCIYI